MTVNRSPWGITRAQRMVEGKGPCQAIEKLATRMQADKYGRMKRRIDSESDRRERRRAYWAAHCDEINTKRRLRDAVNKVARQHSEEARKSGDARAMTDKSWPLFPGLNESSYRALMRRLVRIEHEQTVLTRRKLVIRLRGEGRTYREIGQELGVRANRARQMKIDAEWLEARGLV